MENNCPSCKNTIEHDGNDDYVQCPSCGGISKYIAKGRLIPAEENGVTNNGKN
jgi:DNA-directed RNA polymerase subunit RPC12/RpoP